MSFHLIRTIEKAIATMATGRKFSRGQILQNVSCTYKYTVIGLFILRKSVESEERTIKNSAA